jgi:hypothetical protein
MDICGYWYYYLVIVSPLVIYFSCCVNLIVDIRALVLNLGIMTVNGANRLIVLMRRKAVIQSICHGSHIFSLRRCGSFLVKFLIVPKDNTKPVTKISVVKELANMN